MRKTGTFAAFSLVALFLPSIANASVIGKVTMDFASGAWFKGDVAFADDFSHVQDVSGILTGYQYGVFGYTGTGSDSLNWVWNNGANYSSGTNNYSTFLMDGPGSGYTSTGGFSNFIQFGYNYSDPSHLQFTSGVSYGGTDNYIDYTDRLTSGSIALSAVPLPASAPLFGAALLAVGIIGLGSKRKKVQAAA